MLKYVTHLSFLHFIWASSLPHNRLAKQRVTCTPHQECSRQKANKSFLTSNYLDLPNAHKSRTNLNSLS